MRSLVACLAGTTAVAVALGGCSGSDAGADAEADATPTSTATSSPAQYCLDSGGTVQQRQPTFGTNNDESAWVALGEPVEVCRFEADDDTRTYVDLVTLWSQQPTLAALAYLSRTEPPSGARGNPAAALCTELGGASGYGPSANGGGLVATDDPADVVIAPCTFADQSFIDEWGIAYYAGGVVRGADLSTLFRFDLKDAPEIFE